MNSKTSAYSSQFGPAKGSLLIRGARIEGGQVQDILIRDGVIVSVHAPSSEAPVETSVQESSPGEPVRVIDAEGLIALPGFVDLHTHLREPGKEAAETVQSGTQAAALGGYTAVFAMANSTPVADSAGVIEQVYSAAARAGWAEVRPVGAVTAGLEGNKLADLGSMADSRAAVRMFSDDGMCVHDAAIMRRALEYVKTFDGFIAQHAQEPRLTEGAQMNEGEVSATLGLPGWPAVAEEAIIARDLLLTEHVNSRLHVCHVSTKGSVELIRWAKERGVRVTAEVTPHHLLLTDDLVASFDPVYKVNPPLRTGEDVQALREAIIDGTIDVIGTDHAPHTLNSKSCEWQAAAMGMTGLETALSVVVEAMKQSGSLHWRRISEIFSKVPARIGGLDDQGQELVAGSAAHIVLVDPEAARVIAPQEMASKGKNSPFKGMTLPVSIVSTIFHGHPVVLEGRLNSPHPAASFRNSPPEARNDQQVKEIGDDR